VEDCSKSFLAKMEHMYKYQVDLYSAYKLAVEAIQLCWDPSDPQSSSASRRIKLE
jgi:hypothetical protein